ncbi:IQ domain-containing protein IQM6-like isoform X2 [Quercus lobata]|uniref:IQ domain-containing protein IQM6-like isoform X2 n=1 Tax=Quercus lobata TaxID=97700 RepID=UPI0012455897|nr:IQ domain-containing protein IQM6-like isoform X2 [Quercus lobata]
MGISFSSPLADLDDLVSSYEAIIVRSVSSVVRNMLRSVGFNIRDSDSTKLKSFGSRKMILEGSLSFKGRELETVFSFKTPTAEIENDVFGRCVSSKTRDFVDQLAKSDSLSEKNHQTPLLKNNRNKAALKLQKVYKSFRTRRRLADCAVLVEQSWWKLLDFAELKRSSISFFDIGKPETAVSRWSRARTRAAKVGKGLCKVGNAKKLALQHWLEAIDPRHRYGHNLQFYYVKWLHCESRQPFFYWLDVGEGKEVNHERCPRSKLQQQCIKYLGPAERKAYEVVVQDGKLVYKQSGENLHTEGGPKDAKWIFVLSTSKTLYVGLKNKGTFQHSSFLAGGATLSAGRLVVEDGILKAVWPHSGHYRPTEENFQELMSFLKEHNVDLTNVKVEHADFVLNKFLKFTLYNLIFVASNNRYKSIFLQILELQIVKSPGEEEEEEAPYKKGSDICLWSNSTEADLSQDTESISENLSATERSDSRDQDSNAAELPTPSMPRLSGDIYPKMNRLKIPNQHDEFANFRSEKHRPSCHTDPPNLSSGDGYETAEESLSSEEDFMVPKMNLFDGYQEEDDQQPIPKEKILQRIDSHKGMKSYQLGKQLSSKWATGAGPRIGCMRDYPSELQARVLEQSNLSPKSRSANASPRSFSRFSTMDTTPFSLSRETTAGRSSLAPEQVTLSQTTL